MRRAATYGLGAAVVLALALAAAWSSEAATVTLWLPVQRLEAEKTMTGSRHAGELPTYVFSAQITESLQGTGAPTVISTYAAGYVVFTWGNSCPSSCPTLRVLKGMIVSTAEGAHYRTLAESLWTVPATSGRVPIEAVTAGPGGNTAAGTITVIDGSQGNLWVNNPEPVSGGTSRDAQVVTEAAFVAVRTELTTAVANDVQAMVKKQAGDYFFVVGGQLGLDLKSDHRIGDEAATFTITITATFDANAFATPRARSLLMTALQAKVPAGHTLDPNSVQIDYDVDDFTADGDVQVTAAIVGYAARRPATPSLGKHIAQRSPREAIAYLQEALPGATVEVKTWPANMPLLPPMSSRINFIVKTRTPV